MFTVYNTLGVPLTREGFQNYPEAERHALHCGQRCHVRFYHPSGAMDYWGPTGKLPRPLWYGGKKMGRPPKLGSDMGAHTIYVSAPDWATAQAIGAGNASEGVRIALALAVTARTLSTLLPPNRNPSTN
jgi:hypothetical protein